MKPLNWRRADLIHWGEYAETTKGRFRKRRVFSEMATNDDKCLFYFCGPDGVEAGPFYEEGQVDQAIHKLLPL